MPTTTNLKTLNIHHLTMKQYEELTNKNENDIYLIMPIPQMITATLNENVELSSGTGTLNFKNEFNKVGDNLSLTNEEAGNGIKIGAGISKVKVSAHIWASSSSRCWFMIRKNGTKIQDMIGQDSSGFLTLDCSPILIEVNENDVITVDYSVSGTATINGGSSNVNASYLTIEAIG